MYDAEGILVRMFLSVLGAVIVVAIYKFIGIEFALAVCGAMGFTSLMLTSDR